MKSSDAMWGSGEGAGEALSCDTMVAPGTATTTGSTIFAKNSDRPAAECQPLVQHPRRSHAAGEHARCQFVRPEQVETTYAHVGSRPYWCWGYEQGFNEHQVAIGNESVHSKLETASEPRLIGMELIRLGLERARTAAGAVEVMTSLIERYGQGKFDNDADVRTYDNSYIVADPTEAFVIETAGHHWAVSPAKKALGISNVYSVEVEWQAVSAGAEDLAVHNEWWERDSGRFNFADAFTKDRRDEGSGAMRRGRSCAILAQRDGNVDAATMMALLSDHGNGADPGEPLQTHIGGGPQICVHGNLDGSGGNTAASLVADLCADESRLAVYWCSLYSPCLSLFLPYFTQGELPPVMAVGDATPSEESPWWLFNRLNYAARNQGDEAVVMVRGRWAGLQEELSESAYDVAAEGAELLSSGRAEDVSARLTSYMAQNTTRMLDEARVLLRDLEEVAV